MAGKGGKRDGAGRKPKAAEDDLIALMDSVLKPSEIWAKVGEKIQSGDMQAAKIWTAYRFGMPKQSMQVEVPNGINLIFTSTKGCSPLEDASKDS